MKMEIEMDIFSETKIEEIVQAEDASAETTEYYQIRDEYGVIDSMRSDKGRNLLKIKEKARRLKQINQRNSYTVVEVFHRTIHTF